MLLYYSLVREHRNLKILFKRAWMNKQFHHFYFYEYFTTHQVLTVPRKLFEAPKKWDKWVRELPFFAFMFPIAIFTLLFAYDVYTIDLGNVINKPLTWIVIVLDAIFLLAIIIIFRKVGQRLRRIDKLWDSQAYEFNLEYILESIGVDKRIDLAQGYVESKLTKKHLSIIKKLWYDSVEVFFNTHDKIRESEALRMLDEFIIQCLSIDIDNTKQVDENSKIDKVWQDLMDWFEKDGRRNVSHKFRSSFTEKIANIKKNI